MMGRGCSLHTVIVPRTVLGPTHSEKVIHLSHVDPSANRAEASAWMPKLLKYRTPSTARALAELAATAVPYVLLWYAMYWSLSHGHVWLYLLMLVPATG